MDLPSSSHAWPTLIAFYNEKTASVGKGRTMKAIYFRAVSFSRKDELWTEWEDEKMGGNLTGLHGSEGCDPTVGVYYRVSSRFRGQYWLQYVKCSRFVDDTKLGRNNLREELLLGGTWTFWWNGLTGDLWNLAKAIVKFCSWEWIIPCTTTGSYAGVGQFFLYFSSLSVQLLIAKSSASHLVFEFTH